MNTRGFTIVSAVFILVVLSLVGGFIANLSSLMQRSQSLSILGARAFFAAESGLQWATFKIREGSGPYNCPTSPSSLTLTQGALTGFTVDVSCTQELFVEDGKTYNLFTLESLGRFGESSELDYVGRTLYAKVIQPGVID